MCRNQTDPLPKFLNDCFSRTAAVSFKAWDRELNSPALKNLLSQADRILETSPALPENRTAACRELLQSALALTDDLIENAPTPAAFQPLPEVSHSAVATGSAIEWKYHVLRTEFRPLRRHREREEGS
jgi:hypothetical protein